MLVSQNNIDVPTNTFLAAVNFRSNLRIENRLKSSEHIPTYKKMQRYLRFSDYEDYLLVYDAV